MPSINEANIIFLALGIALLILGGAVQQREIYSGVLITEYLLILLPNLFYLKIRGYSFKKVLKLNPISLKQLVYTVMTMIFAYPMAVFLNYIMMILVNSVSDAIPTGVPIPTNWSEYWLGIFVIAITPGICEEVMFRGTIQSAYEKLGDIKALIISAALFGLFHFNLLNLLGPTFLGIILGIIMLKTRSLYATIIGHTVNNGIALSLGFLMSGMLESLEEAAAGAPLLPEGIEIIAALVMLAGGALFSTVILLLVIKHFPKSEENIMDVELYDDNFPELHYEGNKFSWIPIVVMGAIFVYINYRYFMM
jgi:hypothetical protein